MAAFGAVIFSIVAGSIKSSWAYTEGVDLASRHPDVVADLGEPITVGWFISGSVSVSGSSGEADFSIPLRGPKGRGTLYVIAKRRAGEWAFELAEVDVQGRTDRISLLSEGGGRVSNKALKLTIRSVTALACARSAPARPAGDGHDVMLTRTRRKAVLGALSIALLVAMCGCQCIRLQCKANPRSSCEATQYW